MTVVQFRPRQQFKPKPAALFSPYRTAKACTCIMIGLWMAPMITWLEFLSETEDGE